MDLWNKTEVERILGGVAVTGQVTGMPSPEYERGFCDALHAVSVLFGVTVLVTPQVAPHLLTAYPVERERKAGMVDLDRL